MSGRYILSREDGTTPVACDDLLTWAEWFEGADEARRVAYTEVETSSVSTVFLALDSGWGGRPYLFETMIFGGKHDQWQNRYCTWDEAESGHAAVLAWLRGEGPKPK